MNLSHEGETFSPALVETFLMTAWLGRVLRYEPVVDSTMDLVRSLAREGAPNGLVVVADLQTAGRGRLGRRWLAPAGVNLSFSILLHPDLSRLRTLSMVAALAVVEAVAQVSELECSIKWPNDVQVGGRKLAGVLLESELRGEQPDFAIAGIGLNVNYAVEREPEIAALATSLLRETGRRHAREVVLAACLDAFERLYEAAEGDVQAAWHGRLNMLGRSVRVSFQGQTEEGLAEDVDEDGSLILLRADGSRLSLPSGEVSLRPPPDQSGG